MNDRIPVELVGVRLQLPTNQPVVLLREAAGTRFLPIWIGAVEATAIAYAVEGLVPQRPLTHDLLRLVAEGLGGTVARVVVTELRDAVFYADLVFERDGEEVHISARPSDAIALAARTGAPIFASPEVIEDAGIEIRDEDEESEIEKFREFLDDLTPEDFVGPEGPTTK
ncbi:MAG TPA: bifunctional nuclease family protein [Acidimicrobiia bacterium]|nr:bifunctional nuclease family protein [Acidimicrobiia bacterium]